MMCPILAPCQNAPAFYAQIQGMSGVGAMGLEIRYRTHLYGNTVEVDTDTGSINSINYNTIVDKNPDGTDRPAVIGVGWRVGPLAHPVWGDEFTAWRPLPPPRTGVRRSDIGSGYSSFHAHRIRNPARGNFPETVAHRDISISVRVGDHNNWASLYRSGMFQRLASFHPALVSFDVADLDPGGASRPEDVNQYRVVDVERVRLVVPENPLTWSPWSPWIKGGGPEFERLDDDALPTGTMGSYSVLCRGTLRCGKFATMPLSEIYDW